MQAEEDLVNLSWKGPSFRGIVTLFKPRGEIKARPEVWFVPPARETSSRRARPLETVGRGIVGWCYEPGW